MDRGQELADEQGDERAQDEPAIGGSVLGDGVVEQ